MSKIDPMNPTLRVQVYEQRIDGKGKHFVDGPGNGFGYDSGTLWPNMRLSNGEDAKAATLIANEAYRQGYLQAMANARAVLGIK